VHGNVPLLQSNANRSVEEKCHTNQLSISYSPRNRTQSIQEINEALRYDKMEWKEGKIREPLLSKLKVHVQCSQAVKVSCDTTQKKLRRR
jgi:hypothetical protein